MRLGFRTNTRQICCAVLAISLITALARTSASTATSGNERYSVLRRSRINQENIGRISSNADLRVVVRHLIDDDDESNTTVVVEEENGNSTFSISETDTNSTLLDTFNSTVNDEDLLLENGGNITTPNDDEEDQMEEMGATTSNSTANNTTTTNATINTNTTATTNSNTTNTTTNVVVTKPSLFDDRNFTKYDLSGLQDINGILIKVFCPTSDLGLGCLCPVGIRWTIEPTKDPLGRATLSMQPANILTASINNQTATTLDPQSRSAQTYQTLVFHYTERALTSPPPPYTGVRLQVPPQQLKYIGVTEGNRLQIRKGIRSIERMIVTESAAVFANLTSSTNAPMNLVIDRRSFVNMSLVEPPDLNLPPSSTTAPNSDENDEEGTVVVDNEDTPIVNKTTTRATNNNNPLPGPVKITMRDSSQLFLKGTIHSGDVESRSVANIQGNILDLFVTGGGAVVVNPYPPETMKGKNPCDNVEIARFAGTCDIDPSLMIVPRERAVLFNNTAIQCGGTNVPIEDEDKVDSSSFAVHKNVPLNVFCTVSVTVALLGLASGWMV